MSIPTQAGHDPLVGIDIGGTKTHMRAEGLEEPREYVLPTADWRRRDWSEDAVRLLTMASELVGGRPIAAMGVGAHGCDDAAECEAFQAAFVRCGAGPIAVVNDAELMPIALGLGGQIGLVAGTGSVAVCRTAADEMLVAGGWGWVIGDEGGAAGLVREATRAVALHLDTGGGRDEPLTGLLFDALDIPSPARIGSSFGSLGSAAAVGRHAHLVFEAAARGSDLAQRVIREGGTALAQLVQRLDRRGAGAAHVVAGGGVIVAQPMLWEAFTAALRDLCGDRIEPHLFRGQPVQGACRLAASLTSGPAAEPAEALGAAMTTRKGLT